MKSQITKEDNEMSDQDTAEVGVQPESLNELVMRMAAASLCDNAEIMLLRARVAQLEYFAWNGENAEDLKVICEKAKLISEYVTQHVAKREIVVPDWEQVTARLETIRDHAKGMCDAKPWEAET